MILLSILRSTCSSKAKPQSIVNTNSIILMSCLVLHHCYVMVGVTSHLIRVMNKKVATKLFLASNTGRWQFHYCFWLQSTLDKDVAHFYKKWMNECKGGDKTLQVIVSGQCDSTKGPFMSLVLSRLLFYQGRPTNDVSSRGIQCELCASQRLLGRLFPGEIQQLDTEGIEWDFSWSLGLLALQYSLWVC